MTQKVGGLRSVAGLYEPAGTPMLCRAVTTVPRFFDCAQLCHAPLGMNCRSYPISK